MAYVFLLISSGVLAFVLGLLQFYMLELLVAARGASARDAIIQNISAVVTLGTVVIYFVSGPLAASMRKRWVMGVAAGCAGLLFVVGGIAGWKPNAWIYLGVLGILLGIYNAAKMASVPLVAEEISRSTTAVNGGMSIIFLLGLLPGFALGTWLYRWLGGQGHWVVGCLLGVAGVTALGCGCRNEEKRNFLGEQRRVVWETLGLLRRHWSWLVGGPLVWGIASAGNLATVALLVRRGLATREVAALVPVIAAGGAVVGTAISPLFVRWRYMVAMAAVAGMACVLPLVPEIARSFVVVAGVVVGVGVLFGVVTNLVDSALLERVRREGKEGTGAALQSAMLALMMVSASGSVGQALEQGWITPDRQFTILGAVGAGAGCIMLGLAWRAGELRTALLWLLSVIGWVVLRLRYRIRVKGWEELKGLSHAIFLPNHPAEIDPVILEVLLWRRYKPRPVVLEDFYSMPWLHGLMKGMGAVPVPNMEQGRSAFKVRRIKRAMEEVVVGGKRGESFLLYPSGSLQRSGLTHIGGASALHGILEEWREAPLVLVRTRGLWGSSFSWYFWNQRPNLLWCLAHGAGVLLGNLLVFTPRREVQVEFKRMPEDFPRWGERAEMNRWLERWYNELGEEEAKVVRYSRWSRRVPRAIGVVEKPAPDVAEIPEEVQRGVCEEFARMRRCKADEIRPEMSLRRDLGLDSLELAEVLVWLEARFGVSDANIAELTTVGAVMKLAAGHVEHTGPAAPVRVPAKWREWESRGGVEAPRGVTLQECFLRACERMGDAAAVADDLAGVRTYRELKVGALALADVFKKWPEENVGVMLPASVAVDVVLMGLLLAGKTPVLVNWTLGARNVRHVVEVSGLRRIVTSLRFVDNVDTIPFDEVEKLLVFLEDVRREQITLGVKLRAWWASKQRPERLLGRVGKLGKDDTAVILFTSGSEAVPKGVPLSHENILSNIRGVIGAVRLEKRDVLYGFLPPFHSFGLTATVLLPIICGMRVAHYPNPNEARRIAHGVGQWRVTLMAGTPTFIKGICRAARAGQLETLRLIVTGAERLTKEVVELVKEKAPGAVLREGYGITECAPIVTMCRVDEDPEGVGRPLEGVEVMIVDMERREPLGVGQQGIILVRGPNVFQGYLGRSAADPFMEVGGKRWYITGDLGYITERGSLVLAGRLKRFVKIGGEMVSLPAVEEALGERWRGGEEGPVLAVVGRERENGRTELWLFTTLPITVEEANMVLREAGFSTLVRIERVERVAAIPVLGTGKADYRTLAEEVTRLAAEESV